MTRTREDWANLLAVDSVAQKNLPEPISLALHSGANVYKGQTTLVKVYLKRHELFLCLSRFAHCVVMQRIFKYGRNPLFFFGIWAVPREITRMIESLTIEITDHGDSGRPGNLTGNQAQDGILEV